MKKQGGFWVFFSSVHFPPSPHPTPLSVWISCCIVQYFDKLRVMNFSFCLWCSYAMSTFFQLVYMFIFPTHYFSCAFHLYINVTFYMFCVRSLIPVVFRFISREHFPLSASRSLQQHSNVINGVETHAQGEGPSPLSRRGELVSLSAFWGLLVAPPLPCWLHGPPPPQPSPHKVPLGSFCAPVVRWLFHVAASGKGK